MFSPAKLNLMLRVLGRRPDGYHDLCLLNTGIDLGDEVEVELGGQGVRVECDHALVPLGEDNLCVRAARAFLAGAPAPPDGVAIRITKRIPVAGGLAGGSSNAAAVLWALNRLTGAGRSDHDLIHLAATIGADAPFFLFRSPAWARGKGEILDPAPALPDWHYLLVGFPFGVSAAWAFAQWDLTSAPSCDNLKNLKKPDSIPEPGTWVNDLEPAVVARHPAVARAKQALRKAGAVGAMMSGSGPTVFGVFHKRPSAERVRASLDLGAGGEIFLARALRGPLIRIIE